MAWEIGKFIFMIDLCPSNVSTGKVKIPVSFTIYVIFSSPVQLHYSLLLYKFSKQFYFLQMSTEEFKENWPTPAEAMCNQHTKTRMQTPPMDYSNNIQQERSQAGVQMDISFLQPSVVYPSPQHDNYERLLHTPVDITAPNPDIHIWAGMLEEQTDVAKNMHPAILSQLKPCKTKDDHNCLYNAICLCLGIPESYQNFLRERTALCIQRHANYFEKLLEASDEICLQTLIKQCKQPFCFEGWGNEFHILALAIILKRNIIVYTTFKTPKGQFYQRKNKNILGLSEEFKKGGEKIEQHMNFEPQQGITCHNPIFIKLTGLHFTALLPRFPHPILCIPPATNLPSIPDNGLLSHLPNSRRSFTMNTYKTRCLASKNHAQLAEYMIKATRREKEIISAVGNGENTVGCSRKPAYMGRNCTSKTQVSDLIIVILLKENVPFWK